MKNLKLVRPSRSIEEEVVAFRQEYLDFNERNINGTAGLIRYEHYEEWLDMILSLEKDKVSKQNVHASTYFSVDPQTDSIVGSIQLRHALSPELEVHGGHIGYSIRPTKRGKGFGKQQLMLALALAEAMNMPKVLLTCYKSNEKSSKTIESCGGVLISETIYQDQQQLNYWIHLGAIKESDTKN